MVVSDVKTGDFASVIKVVSLKAENASQRHHWWQGWFEWRFFYIIAFVSPPKKMFGACRHPVRGDVGASQWRGRVPSAIGVADEASAEGSIALGLSSLKAAQDPIHYRKA